MKNQTVTELAQQTNLDFLICTHSNPAVIAQLQVWQMVKETADWPPQTMGEVVMMAKQMNQALGSICPSYEVTEYVIEDEEHGEDE